MLTFVKLIRSVKQKMAINYHITVNQEILACRKNWRI